MTLNDRNALEALQVRLGHVEAIADLCARQDDTELGEVVRGISAILSDLNERLEKVINP
jgi:hypothetical protein